MRCAASLDEFAVGQPVQVADLRRACMRPGVVTALTRTHVEVMLDDDGTSDLHRPYEVAPGPLPAGQIALFEYRREEQQ